MNHRFVLTGGPGAGKTTLLSVLGECGYPFVLESARRIIKERLAAGLSPRPDPVAFAQQILSADIDKYRDASACDVMFFDRGVLDALYMLEAESALTHSEIAEYVQAFPYNNIVFLLPPWEEIYGKDSERDQTFEEAVEVFEGMKRWYCQWGYETLNVPRGSAYERASYIVKSVKALTNRF
ncbi:AAA family ATPase [Halomonas sp. AOP22-C1-8]|uniref:AAA family ATPase n=1 Tax=Halomonas sp. AOP22-C1-8 TaxID=3457717 RepID=UPI004033A3B4